MSFIIPGMSGVGGKSPPSIVYANTYSVSLDGSNDYISVANHSSLNFGDSSTDNPCSFLFSLKFDSASSGAERISSKGYSAAPEHLCTVTGANKYSIQFFDGNTSNSIGRASVDSVVRGTWQQLLITYDGNGLSSGIKMYLDGSELSTTDNSAGSYTAMHAYTNELQIGAITSISSYMQGLFSEVCFYSKELSSTDASSIYNGGTRIDPRILDTSAVVMYLGLEENTGTSVADTGDNYSNDGTISGGTWSSDAP